MTFLHLSDIHFADFEGEKGHDLEQKVRDLMLEDIDRMHGSVGDMDAVLLVGDIANTGASVEYEVAAEFLDRTCELIHCPKDHVVCVPGNHDIDRRKHDLVHYALREHLRRIPSPELSDRLRNLLSEPRGAETLLAPLSAYNQFALRYGCAIEQTGLTWAPKQFPLGGRGLLVHGITSPWVCDATDSNVNDNEKVAVGAFQCGPIVGAKDQVGVAMVHHPQGWQRDVIEVEPWINRAHIILTGHEHEAGITLDAAGRRVTIASGAVNPARTQSGWIPAYNVLQLHLVEQDLLELRIHVRCWRGDVAGFAADRRFDDPYPVRIRLGPPDEEEAPSAPPDAPPPLPPEPIDSAFRLHLFRVMRATPDSRHRVARELGLVGDSEGHGLELDRAILANALSTGRLEQLAEGIEND